MLAAETSKEPVTEIVTWHGLNLSTSYQPSTFLLLLSLLLIDG